MKEPGARTVIPQIRTTDIGGSIDFYTTKLGFDLEFRFEDFYAGIRVGQQLIHLKLTDDPDPSIPYVAAGGHLHLYFEADGLDALAEQFRHRGVEFVSEPADTEWNTREFYVKDNQGHVLCFGEAKI